jgi:phosphoglycerol transferase
MRIAYLNPWKHAAENQAFRSLQLAAARIGHELIHCADSDEIEVQQPDFVLATASTQPKLNDCPHYGTIHEPRDRFLTNRDFYVNLQTYDGYLTISGTLSRFLRDVMFSAGRSEGLGFYYNTCQRQERTTDLASLIAGRRLIVTYFGTNWDHRRGDFFRILSDRDGVQICGPEHSWPHINRKAYGGAPAFDGDSVQARYADNGIGLCFLSEQHLRDDIVSNRIFEVASVGAIAICCDTPWIRRHFGDSVYYVDQTLADNALVDAIMRRVDEIYAHPEEALRRAGQSRRIFEETFAAEALLGNAIEYHERVGAERAAKRTRARQQYEPLISVIVRCGGRPLADVETALRSIVVQTYGRFEVLFVRHGELDLSPLLQRPAPNVATMRVIDCPGGGRSATLWAGLQEVAGDYFCILDDDDWLFSDHFERLFQPFPAERLNRFMAFSGSIAEHRRGKPIMGGGTERRAIFKFGLDESPDPCVISGSFASNCFVASADLLHADVMQDPGLHTGEDSYLIFSLMAQTQPRFSYAATSGHLRGDESQSNFLQHRRRFEDELSLRTRLRYNLASVSNDKWLELSEFWDRRPPREGSRRERTARSLAADPLAGRCVVSGFDPKRARFSGRSAPDDSSAGSAFVQCVASPGGSGAELPLPFTTPLRGEHVLLTEVVVDQGAVEVAVLDASRNEMLRQTLWADWQVQTVSWPAEDPTPGAIIVRNSTQGGTAIARVVSIRLYAHHDAE